MRPATQKFKPLYHPGIEAVIFTTDSTTQNPNLNGRRDRGLA